MDMHARLQTEERAQRGLNDQVKGVRMEPDLGQPGSEPILCCQTFLGRQGDRQLQRKPSPAPLICHAVPVPQPGSRCWCWLPSVHRGPGVHWRGPLTTKALPGALSKLGGGPDQGPCLVGDSDYWVIQPTWS